jgi:hypothetical protein
MLVREGDHSCGSAGERDRVAEAAFPGGVEDGVDLPGVSVGVHLCPELGAVPDGDRAEFPGEFLVARSRGADDRGALGQGQLGGDEADRAAAAEDEQRLAGGERSCRRVPTAASAEAGSAAASAQLTAAGFAVQEDARAYSPYPPRAGSMAATSSPACTPVTAGPRASTVPAASKPRTADGGSGKTCARSPRRILRSVGLTPAARTRILIWPGPGSGMATDNQASTSGGPYLVSTGAYGMVLLLVTVASASRRGVARCATGVAASR